MRTFFSAEDYHRYLRILAKLARRYELEAWAYCLMPNHVHLLVVPSSEAGLARPIGEAHRRYALEVNRRHGWTGHLWQERFASFPMDSPHLHAADRYVLLNPVRSGFVSKPDGYHGVAAVSRLMSCSSWLFCSALTLLAAPVQCHRDGVVARQDLKKSRTADSEETPLKRLRLILTLVLAILVVIVVLQNTEGVETRVLFATVTMPRAVLLLTTTLIGFALGILTSLVWMRRKDKAGASDKRA